jgi:hypothetical protein
MVERGQLVGQELAGLVDSLRIWFPCPVLPVVLEGGRRDTSESCRLVPDWASFPSCSPGFRRGVVRWLTRCADLHSRVGRVPIGAGDAFDVSIFVCVHVMQTERAFQKQLGVSRG